MVIWGYFRATPLYTTLFSVDYNLYRLQFLFILSLAEIPVLPGLGCLSMDLSVSTRRIFVFLQCSVWSSWSCLVVCPWIFLYLFVFLYILSLLQCRVSWFSSSTCCWAGRCAASTSWRSSNARRMRSSSSQQRMRSSSSQQRMRSSSSQQRMRSSSSKQRQPGARAHAHWDAYGRVDGKGWKTKNGLGEEKQRVGVGSGVGGQDPVGSCGRVYAMVQWAEETKYKTGCVRTYGCVEEQWGR